MEIVDETEEGGILRSKQMNSKKEVIGRRQMEKKKKEILRKIDR